MASEIETKIEMTENGSIDLSNYETVIGLEVHIELSTKTKIFCSCDTSFGGEVNAHTCPVCTGMPGALPVLNKKVVEYAIALGQATNCEINRNCRFDRKNYFYPDNPQNYQISQLYAPICVNGRLIINTEDGEKTIRIHEMHMEEDAGKLIHDEEAGVSLVDYNRSGVPLIEVVSEPDMRNANEVIGYLEKLKMICQYLGISDCKLQEGSMRVDVNLSVRKIGSEKLGTRTEMKNLNSFRAITNAIENEAKRQIKLIENGEEVILETRRWDDIKMESYSMRSKEEAKDYRYFPEPDLVELTLEDSLIDNIKEAQPEFADEKKERYVPYVIEPSLGADRVTLAFLCAAYDEEELEGNDVRTVLHFHPAIAPVKIGVLPLSKKLNDGATKVYEELSKLYNCEYDDRGNIGKRYRRQDEIGTPFCVTYDFESEEDGAVTVRDRDTMKQDRVKISDLKAYFEEKLAY